MADVQKIVIKGVKQESRDLFDKQVKKIEKMSKRLDVKPPIIKTSDVYPGEYRAYVGETLEGSKYRKVIVDVFDVTIELPETLKFEGGWEIKAIIGHLENIIIPIDPDNYIPEDIDPSDSTCDHCGVKRYRTKTFLIQNDENQWKRVGGGCVKKFLGVNASSFFNFLQAIKDFKTPELMAYDEDMEDFDGDRSRKLWNPDLQAVGIDLLVTISDNQIKEDGKFIKNEWTEIGTGNYSYHGHEYTKMVRSNEGESTSDKVKESCIALDGKGIEINNSVVNDFYKYLDSIEVKGREVEHESNIYDEYGNCKIDDNGNPVVEVKKVTIFTNYEEYLLKCKSFADRKRIRMMEISNLVSAFNTYLKFVEESKKPQSSYIGTIGEKSPLELEVKSIKYISSPYGGTNCVYSMVDKNNNIFTKFGTINKRYTDDKEEVKEGTIVRFNGEVKKHNEFNGKKQTIIGRLSKFNNK